MSDGEREEERKKVIKREKETKICPTQIGDKTALRKRERERECERER